MSRQSASAATPVLVDKSYQLGSRTFSLRDFAQSLNFDPKNPNPSLKELCNRIDVITRLKPEIVEDLFRCKLADEQGQHYYGIEKCNHPEILNHLINEKNRHLLIDIFSGIETLENYKTLKLRILNAVSRNKNLGDHFIHVLQNADQKVKREVMVLIGVAFVILASERTNPNASFIRNISRIYPDFFSLEYLRETFPTLILDGLDSATPAAAARPAAAQDVAYTQQPLIFLNEDFADQLRRPQNQISMAEMPNVITRILKPVTNTGFVPLLNLTTTSHNDRRMSILHHCDWIEMLTTIATLANKHHSEPILFERNFEDLSYADVALAKYDLKIVQFLFEEGLDDSYRDADGNNILHLAAENPHSEVFLHILKTFPNLLWDNHSTLELFLMRVIKEGNFAVMKQIIEKHGKLKSPSGNSLRDIIAQHLRFNNAEQNLTNINIIHTSLVWLISHPGREKEYLEFITYLAHNFPNLCQESDSDGFTPFHYAMTNNKKVAQILLQACPDLLTSSVTNNIAQEDKLAVLRNIAANPNPAHNLFPFIIKILEQPQFPQINEFLLAEMVKFKEHFTPEQKQEINQRTTNFLKNIDSTNLESFAEALEKIIEFSPHSRNKKLKNLLDDEELRMKILFLAIINNKQILAEQIACTFPNCLDKISESASTLIPAQLKTASQPYNALILAADLGRDDILQKFYEILEKAEQEEIRKLPKEESQRIKKQLSDGETDIADLKAFAGLSLTELLPEDLQLISSRKLDGTEKGSQSK